MSEKKGENMNSSEEYLKDYINNNDYDDPTNIVRDNRSNNENNNERSLGSTTKDAEFMALSIEEFPCAPFYPAGTTVMVRSATVPEIQHFSTVDDTNFYDVYEKVNYMVSSCVFIKSPNGTKLPYTNLVDGDRWYLIFLIRDLTFQKGNDLYTEGKGGVKIPLKRGYFTFHKMEEKLSKYYDKVKGIFSFKTKIGDIDMAPPTIGLQKSFTDYMIEEAQNKREIDKSFLKIIPYTLPNRTSITKEGIKKKLEEFRNMDGDLFQFLNQVVQKMSFGISGVKTITESGEEVHSDNVFPTGVSGLFLLPDAIDDFLI